MSQNISDILMVGPQGPFREFIDHLEEQESCRLHCALDCEAASSYLSEHSPDVIILTIGPYEQDHAETLEWLRVLKNLAPVLILSPAEDWQFHMTAIQNGAFDFLTAYAPPSEVDRALNAALTFQACHIA